MTFEEKYKKILLERFGRSVAIKAKDIDFIVKRLYEDMSTVNDKATSQVLIAAASDEATAVTAGTAKVTFRMPYGFNLTEVRASLTTAGSTSGTTTVDINAGGVSILSTPLTIDFGEKSSVTAAVPAVISTTSLADNAEITVDVDAVTGGADETGLKVYLIGTTV